MKAAVMDMDLVRLLKQEVEQCFGKKVMSYGDTVELSREIFSKTSLQISQNTLRRFFGWQRKQMIGVG
jgi:hypothetical protein